MTALEIGGIRVARGGRAVLDGADWSVAPGELHVVTGATGAGKSTLLALAALSLAPQAGDLSLFGAPAPAPDAPEAPALRRRIGAAEQRPRFLEHLALGENVSLPLRLTGRDPRDRAAQARELLDWLGLGDRAGDPPAALSEGERRRAALARAVIAGPELILADEPSEAQDRPGVARALEMLAALAEHGAAVVIATRDAELVRLARHHVEARLWRLEDGRLAPGAAA
ncbi:ATP-binding cassette domain-containing protein [Albimonas sp. CAU 1670]|uniref:ATP-binding cassette domain-containing protein n=1 Tax=Albimonas sp. CAU 1670 TaxID=3032599 RepID=UPI0023DA7E1F|nr:ATP-binding cassette domain-containing protein [Albimonas sp. CAU 1670]MDF2233493.1 ATP-binding cassette domain-containing protein [Albimonas sp. CAU 1670]